jgi:hypothetical protein
VPPGAVFPVAALKVVNLDAGDAGERPLVEVESAADAVSDEAAAVVAVGAAVGAVVVVAVEDDAAALPVGGGGTDVEEAGAAVGAGVP